MAQQGNSEMMQRISRWTFACVSGALMILAAALGLFGMVEFVSVTANDWKDAGDALLTTIGYLVIAVAVFDVAKYFMEDAVLSDQRTMTVSAARRSLLKFISTIAIAVFIEGLVMVFQVSKRDISQMLFPTALLITAVFIVIGMGVYHRLSVESERKGEEGNKPL
jgi:hypothetical protein